VLDARVAPAHLWVPDFDATNGDLAAQVGADLGLPPDPDQRLILDAIYGYRAGEPSKPACFEVGVLAPRQNIKTSTLEIGALTDLFVFGVPLHIWTAHLFKTARETFMHMVQLIESNREYRRLCKAPRTANGSEQIELLTGEQIQFHARSKGGGRGLTAPRVTLDEALFLQPLDMGALLPTLATKEDAQVRYASSACLVSSDVLRGLRDRGRARADRSLAYVEWCAEFRPCASPTCPHTVGSDGCALDDRELWGQANCALGRRITVDTLAKLRQAMPPSEFAREFLGWHEDPAVGAVGLSADDWEACADRDAEPVAPIVLAFDVAPGMTSASIVACGGPLHVADHRRGASWVVERVVELAATHEPIAVGVDPSGPAGALIPDLENAGVELTLLDGRESVQACSAFLNGVLDRSLVHRDQHALNDAVLGAGQRQVGDAWKWSRRDSTVDISPLVAATVARFLWTRGTEKEAPVFAY
jgi:hypothetical protein